MPKRTIIDALCNLYHVQNLHTLYSLLCSVFNNSSLCKNFYPLNMVYKYCFSVKKLKAVSPCSTYAPVPVIFIGGGYLFTTFSYIFITTH